VLKKDAEIFPKNTFEGEIWFLNLLKWRNFKLQSDSEPKDKHFGGKKNHSIDSLCLQTCFEMSKNSEKSSKKTQLWLNLPLLKWFWVNHNFLDWYENFPTRTRLVCATIREIQRRPEGCPSNSSTTLEKKNWQNFFSP